VSGEVWLSATGYGDRLELAAAGAWTADNAAEIEKLIVAVVPEGAGATGRVYVDMGGVEQFDTYGAWLLERLLRGMNESGLEIQVHALADRHRILFDNVTGVKPPPRRRPAGDVFSDMLYTLGRSTAALGWRSPPCAS
jgi:phospholipid/cholesterol/gamma-HCH transport system permease protein